MGQLKKVGNRFLCYTCTLQYKRSQKKIKKRIYLIPKNSGIKKNQKN
jgi:hypothetical protein